MGGNKMSFDPFRPRLPHLLGHLPSISVILEHSFSSNRPLREVVPRFLSKEAYPRSFLFLEPSS